MSRSRAPGPDRRGKKTHAHDETRVASPLDGGCRRWHYRGLLASQASASPTRGPEAIRSVQYEVGDGSSVGPFTMHGVVNSKGNVTDTASLTKGPANSSRQMFVDPNGSFTVLVTGGTNPTPKINPQTCFVHFTIRNFDAKIVAGTGAYRHATGDFKADATITGNTGRLANGSCDTSQNGPSPLQVNVVAGGLINLH